MGNLIAVRRVTVVADAALEQMLLEEFVRVGAKGYTCVDCRGRGGHEGIEDPFSGSSRVRIETVVQPDTANRIVAYLSSPEFDSHALFTTVEAVHVDSETRI
ncbi:MAG: P-II family nitrogen regulator [Planctomycetaceae bacterium]